MTQKINATTADVLVAFQTRPGVDSDAIIKAGEATIKGTTTKIKPQGKGYYGFKMEADTTVTVSTVTMRLLGTDYHVYYQEKDELETSAEDVFAITCWKEPGNEKKLPGIQRRLQMMGYYKGRVDAKRGNGTEFGILNFQADNKLRTDGEIGNKTRSKIKDITDKKNKSGQIYISRRSLIRFDWAPHSKNAKLSYGWPQRYAPMIDDRGSVKVKSAGINLHGPVVSVQVKTWFRVKVIREFIDKNATLIATSDDTNLVEIKSPSPLPKEEMFILKMASKDPGRKPKATSVRIKYKQGDKETEIASLQVIVTPVKIIKVRPCYVTVKDSTGASKTPAGTAGGSTDAAEVFALNKFKKDFRMVKALARSILRHYGIYVKYLAERNKTVTLSKAGTLSKKGDDHWRTEFNKIMNTKDSSNKASSKSEVNVFLVYDVEDARGLCWDAKRIKWPNGIVMMEDPEGVMVSAWILAHELGHMLGLANFFINPTRAHADDDPDEKHKRNDLWTVSRLMYALTGHKRPYNPGFGYKKPGGKVSIRNLPSDGTDDEMKHANSWARNSKFYCNP